MSITGARFTLGHVVCTSRVNDVIAEDSKFAKFVMESLGRHVSGDWGDLCKSDKKENEYALGKYLRLLSSYTYDKTKRIWVITEADRSSTCVYCFRRSIK